MGINISVRGMKQAKAAEIIDVAINTRTKVSAASATIMQVQTRRVVYRLSLLVLKKLQAALIIVPPGRFHPVRCYHATLPQDKAFGAATAMTLP